MGWFETRKTKPGFLKVGQSIFAHDYYAFWREYPTALGVKDRTLAIDLPHESARYSTACLSCCSALRFEIAPACLRRATFVARQITCVSSRSSSALSFIKG